MAGTIQDTNYFYPFGGNRGGAFGGLTTKRFTGQYHESSLPGGEGLYFYNARWYDAKLGRFVSADTLVPSPGNPQSFNRYSYVYNNPLKYNDPSGHAGIIANCMCGGGSGINVTYYEFPNKQWQSVRFWSDHFELPQEFLAAVIAAEVLYDTDWYDAYVDPVIGLIAYSGIVNPGNWAESVLEYSEGGFPGWLPIIGNRTFGPGIGQVHAQTAIEAEEHFGQAFPILPKRTSSWRHWLLVQDSTNIMYVAAILRMYSDQRPGSRTKEGQMTVNEMGAVFANFHEDVSTAFDSEEAYRLGSPPTSSGQRWVDQLRPLVWFYRLYGQ